MNLNEGWYKLVPPPTSEWNTGVRADHDSCYTLVPHDWYGFVLNGRVAAVEPCSSGRAPPDELVFRSKLENESSWFRDFETRWLSEREQIWRCKVVDLIAKHDWEDSLELE